MTTRIIVQTRTFTFYTVVFYAGSILLYIGWLYFYDVAGNDTAPVCV